MALKSGELWYYRTSQAVVADVAVAQAIVVGLISFISLNASSILFIHLFDTATIPNDGATPLVRIPINPNGIASYTPYNKGRKFKNGLVVALSSTATQLTKVGTNDLLFQAEGIAP
jgi:hypothetical protein